ncbi:hypothetical protein C1T31_09420 [Hanstruepera neustonica]|uniref:VWFA domain-containing protein n=1 Tax=Hanstruepera neustonica TaxID=1445657 RepID=A0A2K1DY05_9FLAO|nr:hypothetical protein [Hanstruepera neustonica]PNQ72916.1 hypothetical protein C1T31_09420 [Hanstruepera neustonica]
MKSLTIILVISLFHLKGYTQEQQVETKSVLLDDFISFIAENYELPSMKSEEDLDEEEDVEPIPHNIVFLIETTNKNPSQEDIILLKQAFRFLAKRLSKNDHVSIIAYSGMNGLVLDKTDPTDTKKTLYALDDIKGQIDKSCRDGIAFAYEYVKKAFESDSNNSVVMIRNPNAANQHYKSSVTSVSQDNIKPKGNGTAIVLTAITLLPELIAVIKD